MKRTETNLINNAKLINERNKVISNLLDLFDNTDEIYTPLLMHNFELVILIAFTDETKYSEVIKMIEKYL